MPWKTLLCLSSVGQQFTAAGWRAFSVCQAAGPRPPDLFCSDLSLNYSGMPISCEPETRPNVCNMPPPKLLLASLLPITSQIFQRTCYQRLPHPMMWGTFGRSLSGMAAGLTNHCLSMFCWRLSSWSAVVHVSSNCVLFSTILTVTLETMPILSQNHYLFWAFAATTFLLWNTGDFLHAFTLWTLHSLVSHLLMPALTLWVWWRLGRDRKVSGISFCKGDVGLLWMPY